VSNITSTGEVADLADPSGVLAEASVLVEEAVMTRSDHMKEPEQDALGRNDDCGREDHGNSVRGNQHMSFPNTFDKPMHEPDRCDTASPATPVDAVSSGSISDTGRNRPKRS
jgi:hypothetical protein